MTTTFRSSTGQFAAFWILFGALVSGQSAPAAEHEDGVPVTDPLVIAKCGNCHARDERGNMQQISWERTTPENWQAVLKRMILEDSVSVTPAEARSIVSYLSRDHGLTPEEALPVMYDPERRIREETNIPDDTMRDTCAKCHAFARALEWRRSNEDWKLFIDSHAARYKIRAGEPATAFLARTAPLHSTEWNSWSTHAHSSDLTGNWIVVAYKPGHGSYYGEMQIERTGDGEYNTRAKLTSETDGSTVIRSGRSVVYGANAWRGRSKGDAATSAADDPSNEAREVLWVAPNQAAAEGRWFWGQYQEFEFDVRIVRATAEPKLIAIDRASLKTGSQVNRVRLTGINFPGRTALADLNFGLGVTIRGILSSTAREVVVEVDVAADAVPGRRDVAIHQSVLTGALAIYDRIDYVAVTPASTVASFGDRTHPKGYQQFEAIGYQRGPDGKLHTADDLAVGPVEVSWAVQVFHAAEGSSSDFVGTMSAAGLFVPAEGPAKNNYDVWVVATAKGEKDRNAEPLVGKSYMVVTIPTYTFNGRQFVRDLDRWVDDGPAANLK